MTSVTEKIHILRKVSIFSETPDDVLADVAHLLDEVSIRAGERIFQKGDMGTCMYIIVEGRVRVHDGEMLLNYLEQGSVFGEMAALDPEPRSASVTAEEDTRLFRLDQHCFYALVQQRIEVLTGVMHVICQHLRARIRDMARDFVYMQQFKRVIAAAREVELGVFQPESLNHVAQRTDELGQLARVFQDMTRQVYHREQQLKQTVQELRIEIDQVKKAHQVDEITSTDYFRDLQQKAQAVRDRMRARQPRSFADE